MNTTDILIKILDEIESAHKDYTKSLKKYGMDDKDTVEKQHYYNGLCKARDIILDSIEN